MAQKTTETVTPNPLPPEQVEYNQQIIDANKAWLETAGQITPAIISQVLNSGGDLDFARDIFRSTGAASDEAQSIAAGGPRPTSTSENIGALYTSTLGRAPDRAGLDFWTNAVNSGAATLADVRNNFAQVAAGGADPLRPAGQTPGIGHNNPPGNIPLVSPQGLGLSSQAPPQGVGLAPNYQQFPALSDAFAQDRREIEAFGFGNLTADEATRIAQETGAQISAAGGVPNPELMNRYRVALNAAAQKISQGGAPQGAPQGGPQGGVGLPGQSFQSTQSFQSAPFDPTADFGLIANAADTAITAGQKDIDRFFGDAMKVLQDNATARGMRFRDSPILDRGGQIATDVLRQKEDLSEGIRAQQASLNLSHPLEKYSILSNVGVNEGRLNLDNRSLAQQADQFTSELGLRNRTLSADVAQRGIENRLSAATSLMDRYNFGVNSGINLINVTRPNQPQFPDPGSTVTGKTSGSSTSQLLGGVGGLASGLGALFSSRELKDVHEDVLPDKALDGVMQTPVSKWTYKGEDTLHIGPMAEDFQKAFGVGDGKTISVIDAIGVLFAAVQELGRKADARI